MLTSLPIKLKLVLLAGVPVIGALLLSYLVARDANRRLDTARALGSIEDLAHLAQVIDNTVDAIQLERGVSSFAMGSGVPVATAAAEQRKNLDAAVAELDAFLKARDVSKLPKRLAEGLANAQQRLLKLPENRAVLESKEVRIEEAFDSMNAITFDLIGATAALTGLSNDGEMLRNISALVTVMHLQERASEELALLNYVFAKREYPPGGYKILVNLVTEQEVFEKVLRQSTSEDLVAMFDGNLKGESLERAAQLRKIALDTMDDNFGVDATEWTRVQSEKLRIFNDLGTRLNERVKNAALAKIAEAKEAVKVSQQLSGAVLLVSVLLALVIALGINRSVRSLAHAAHEVQTRKDFHVRAKKVSHDELGRLTDAFNEMLDGIQARDEELENHRVNLEQLVEARTAELAKRNAAMRIVLDNVDQGLATINADGNLDPERSAAFDTWFHSRGVVDSFATILSANDNNAEAMLRLGWEGVQEGFLPRETAIAQIPRQLVRDGKHYQLDYKLMGDDAHLDGALLMVTDVTTEVERRAKEAEQRELIAVFEAVMKDRTGFIEFFNETEKMLEQVISGTLKDPVVEKRVLHTVKGNTAIYGVNSVAATCHVVESGCIEENRSPTSAEREQLNKSWGSFASRVRLFANQSEEDVLEVQYEELEKLLAATSQRLPHEQLRKMLEALRHEPTAVRFARISEQAKRLAKRLHKGELQIIVDSNGIRLPNDRWSDFWNSFIHVVRNALDHGIESEQERKEAGKPPSGTLRLTSRRDGDNFVLEFADDGRGINWDRVAQKARESGLAHSTRQNLVDALFADGVSTRESADELSGRGVGMSAVRQACRALGGEITVHSEPGHGTTWRFTVPCSGNDRPNAGSIHPGARPSIQPPRAPARPAARRASGQS